MAWFRDKGESRSVPEPAPQLEELDAAEAEATPLVIPRLLPLDDAGQRRIDAALAALSADGVDAGNLGSLAAGYDRTYLAWSARRASKRADHDPLVERYGLGIAHYLTTATDLRWGRVSDAFGVEIGVGSDRDDDFLVPTNLVAVRWMNGETGWVAAVVGTIVGRRAGRAAR